MSKPIVDKKQMYELLASGLLGNTTQQWFDFWEWNESPESQKYTWWGVRSLTPGGPCRLNCHREDVGQTVSDFASAGHQSNISVMLDRICLVTLWADIWDSPSGVVVYGIEDPPEGGSWRALMPSQGRHWFGIEARMLLKRHLNPNSLADVEELFEQWPNHVLELSAIDRCMGIREHRNSISWELRAY